MSTGEISDQGVVAFITEPLPADRSQMMNSRERVLRAVNHKEPDRVPIDLGGTVTSGIMAGALHDLRRYLGLEQHPVKVPEVLQMLGEVEADVIDALGVDVLPIEPLVRFLPVRRDTFKPWTLFDGTEVLMPTQFEVSMDEKGGWVMHEGGDPCQPVIARMPRNGFYFDMPADFEMHDDFVPPSLAEIRKQAHVSEEDLDHMQARAEKLRAETDKALVLGSSYLGLQGVGSIPDFLYLLASDKVYIRDLFAVRTETALANLEKFRARLGDKIDIITLDAPDFGSQKAELFSPEWFAELYVPYLKIQNDWIHTHTSWKTWQHSCGSIPKLIGHLIESGLDILNPVQCSAAGMDPAWLKQIFGSKITFWGGSVDTQQTLPFGTPEEVVAEVAQRIRIFGPGGGFVFNPIHNIQHGTPPENIVAAYHTAREKGKYPIT